ncbi:MAG: 30S ribosomal protein S20 [Candidatus Wildermuthbacteria bacterium]|nr:30S ribosomal protein S20 [Candidatus Wildermuthbacteria bacterium]
MPITKSAKKALRQSKRRMLKNRGARQEIRTAVKKMRELAGQKNIEEAKQFLPRLYQVLDKAAKRRVIEKNTAARKKSRLTRLFNSLKTNSK